MKLSETLADWTDWDLAAYRLGQSLGLFEGMDFHVHAKHLFWTDNALGDGLHAALVALVSAEVLERREDPDDQYRWRS